MKKYHSINIILIVTKDKWRLSVYLLALTSLYNPPLLRLLSGEQRCLVFLGYYVEDAYYPVVLFVSHASTSLLTSPTFKINIFSTVDAE